MVVLTVVVCGRVALCQQFNRFKSYKNEKVRPARYEPDGEVTHDIQDYLDASQKIMHKKRYSLKDDKEDLFDNKWTGFSEAAKDTRKKRPRSSKNPIDRKERQKSRLRGQPNTSS